jgi:hypothetical protein
MEIDSWSRHSDIFGRCKNGHGAGFPGFLNRCKGVKRAVFIHSADSDEAIVGCTKPLRFGLMQSGHVIGSSRNDKC